MKAAPMHDEAARLTTLVRSTFQSHQLPTVSDPERAKRLLRANLKHIYYCSRAALFALLKSGLSNQNRCGVWGVHDARLADGLLDPRGGNGHFIVEPDGFERAGHPLEAALPDSVMALLDAVDPTTANQATLSNLIKRLDPTDPKTGRSLQTVSPQVHDVATYLRGIREFRKIQGSIMPFAAPTSDLM